MIPRPRILLCFLCFSAAALATCAVDLPVVGIAHVAFQSSNLEVSRAFYTGMLGYEKAFATGSGEGEAVYFKVNDEQFVKLVKVPGTTADDRLVEVALQVTDTARTEAMLRERGLDPTPIEYLPDGTRATTLRDPDGHLIAFVEYVPDSQQVRSRGRHLGARRESDRLWHAGVSVTDEQRARAFYEEKLGFVETWRGGPEGQPTAWINVRMPGERGDYLEYMLVRGTPDRERLGSMHHVCFQVADIRVAHRGLEFHGLQDIERYHPRIGRNGRWLFNVHDPDGTRSEFMEPHPATAGSAQDTAASPRYFSSPPGSLPRAKARLAAGDPLLGPALEKLKKEARAALEVAPLSVTHKTRPGASGDLHDYASQAPYLWPDPSKPDGLPYVPRDGVINPESRNPDFTDRDRIGLLYGTVEPLALAYFFTGDETYAAQAARCLRVWFLDPATRMNPNMEYAQAVPGRNTGRGIGIIDSVALTATVEWAGLLAGSPAWTPADQAALDRWTAAFLGWLLHSENGRYEAAMRQNHGTYYDLQVVRLALVLGRQDLARSVLEAARTRRIALQVEPDGGQPMELRRTKAFSYSVMNLRGLITLATFAEHAGVDLWNFATEDGRGIRRAVDFMVPYVRTPPKEWPYQQIVPKPVNDMATVLRAAAIAYGDDDYETIVAGLAGVEDDRFQLLRPSPHAFVALGNGHDFGDWVQRGGRATYAWEEGGVIVGTSVADTPNSFLCTDRAYADFVLEYDFKVDERLNSGVQIRSECHDRPISVEVQGKPKEIPAGRVHGYQVEIDPDVKRGRLWSAGIFDEARRGWLVPAPGDKAAEAAFSAQGRESFRPGSWNRVRVEARGDRIRTWLNGHLRADLRDALTPRGFIALQVHSIPRADLAGTQVRWRSLRLAELPAPDLP